MNVGQADLVIIRRVDEEVVVTMNPQRAEFVAEFLVSDDPGTGDWLDELAEGLCAAAGPGRSSATLGPPQTPDGSPPDPVPAAENPLDDKEFVEFARAVMSFPGANQADVAAAVEAVAARAVLIRQQAIQAAAEVAHRAAVEAWAVREAEVSIAVAAMLETVQRAAALEQENVDREAEVVADAAAEAARLATQWDRDGKTEAERAAIIAGLVDSTARAMEEQSKARAADMAQFAAYAAVAAAEAAIDAQARIDLVVADAAETVRQVAADAEDLVTTQTIDAAAVVRESR